MMMGGKKFLSFSVIAALICNSVSSTSADSSNSVEILTDDNFDQQIFDPKLQDTFFFVKFYAPWCGHCKSIAPVMDELATQTDLKGAVVAKIDCTVHTNVCGKFNVKGYPTLKGIKGGKAYDFKGQRSLSSFKEFILTGHAEVTPNPVKASTTITEGQNASKKVEILTDGNFDDAVFKAPASTFFLVKFYAPWCGHCKKLAPIWDELAPQTDARIVKVDCTEHKEVCGRFDIKGYPTIKGIMDGKSVDHAGSRSLEALQKFIKISSEGPNIGSPVKKAATTAAGKSSANDHGVKDDTKVVVLSGSSDFASKVEKSTHGWMLMFYAPWCGHCKKMKPDWHKLSLNLDSNKDTQVKVGMVDCTQEKSICSKFKITGYPTLYFFKDSANIHKYSKGRALSQMEDFALGGFVSAPKMAEMGPSDGSSGGALALTITAIMDWAMVNTVPAVAIGFVFLGLCVMILVTILDACMGEKGADEEEKKPKKE